MKIIKQISEQIEKELDQQEYLIKKAIEYKETYPTVALAFYNESLNKDTSIRNFHDQVILLINDYRNTNGEPPAHMMAVYNYLHERHIDKAATIKNLQAMYKDNKI